MSKLNPLVKPVSKFDPEVKLAGGFGLPAARQDSIALLRRSVLAYLLWEDNFYIDGESIAKIISELIPKCDPKEVSDLAFEARSMQKLRHVPLFIAVEMCKYPEHKKYVSHLLPKIITRADMITDCVAIYAKQNGGKIKPLAAQMKKGLASAFENFNEYALAKYDRNAKIKLCDVMSLVRPKPETKDRAKLYKKVLDRNLTVPDTWEVALSTGKDKRATWERLIKEEKIGGLAMLRNISNMMKAGLDKATIKQGLENIKSDMLLPLNFLMAHKMNPEFSREIEETMIRTYAHLPKLPGKTLFIVDTSGSMSCRISSKSDLSRQDAANAMAMFAAFQSDNYKLVLTAGNDHTRVGAHKEIKYPQAGFGLFSQIKSEQVSIGGGGIFTRQCLEWCADNVGREFDRIIVFSDSQDCDNVNKRTPKPFGKYNYICDVSAHKNGINYKGVWTSEISGFSEKFITYIASMEGNENYFQ